MGDHEVTYQMKMKIARYGERYEWPYQAAGCHPVVLAGIGDAVDWACRCEICWSSNLVWIITDYDIDVTRLPRFREITNETEALTYNRLFATGFWFDEAGQAIIQMIAASVLDRIATNSCLIRRL